MRTTKAIQGRFVEAVGREYEPAGDQPSPGDLFGVELSFYLLETVAPGSGLSASGVPGLIDGYRSLWSIGVDLSDDALARMVNARTILWRSHRAFGWPKVLEGYRTVPEHIRGYSLDDDDVPIRRLCRVAPDRWAQFEELLAQPLPYKDPSKQIAPAGTYRMRSTIRGIGVTVPDDLPAMPDPVRHNAGVRRRSPLKVAWTDLIATADDMDNADRSEGRGDQQWAKRLAEARLKVRAVDDSFESAEELVVDELLHMVGMVSVGKTTLVKILAVWAARNGLNVTLVVGDNAASLAASVELSRYAGVNAAPAMGLNRARHVEQQHYLNPPATGELLPSGPETFDLLSTACALDSEGLRSPTSQKLDIARAPCTDLAVADPDDEAENWKRGTTFVCPFWHGCQRHEASRRLVEANVWTATPWSLVHTQLPGPLTTSEMRYLEAAWRRSDLILVDEADQVQANFDEMFASAQALHGSGDDAWIDIVTAELDNQLRARDRAPIRSQVVRRFQTAGNQARTASSIIYQMFRRDRDRPGRPVLSWLDHDQFTAWTLFDTLAKEWSGAFDQGSHEPASTVRHQDPLYRRLRVEFNAFIDEPTEATEGAIASDLSELARVQQASPSEDASEERIREWLSDFRGNEIVPGRTIEIEEEGLDAAVWRLELAIAVAVLSTRLNFMLLDWPQVANELDLRDALTTELRLPPRDLIPAVPESAMGNVLGFQYLVDEDREKQSGALGEIRFFRYSGVGRALLIRLPDLFPGDGVGPNVILLSGTSWAGTSPRYHIDVPVDAILLPTDQSMAAINKTTFSFAPLTPSGGGAPIRISGRYGPERDQALAEMLRGLTRPGPGNGPSRLEQERDDLPENRRKVLLLVGSYREARTAANILRRDSRRLEADVRCLVPDDEQETGWDDAHLLPRGELASFGTDSASLLIAPMLAVERGHNILNSDGVAAIGAAFFLVRPHPHPHDLSYVTQSINQLAIKQMNDPFSVEVPDVPAAALLAAAANERRKQAQRVWRRLLHITLAYSLLGDDDRERLAWTQLVTIWQVIGRLLRGGQAARVYFCDAAFMPRRARGSANSELPPDDETTSLLYGIGDVLSPYFDQKCTDPDRHLVRALYAPFHQALTNMEIR